MHYMEVIYITWKLLVYYTEVNSKTVRQKQVFLSGVLYYSWRLTSRLLKCTFVLCNLEWIFTSFLDSNALLRQHGSSVYVFQFVLISQSIMGAVHCAKIYSVNLRIQSECGKIRTRKTPIRALFVQ